MVPSRQGFNETETWLLCGVLGWFSVALDRSSKSGITASAPTGSPITHANQCKTAKMINQYTPAGMSGVWAERKASQIHSYLSLALLFAECIVIVVSLS